MADRHPGLAGERRGLEPAAKWRSRRSRVEVSGDEGGGGPEKRGGNEIVDFAPWPVFGVSLEVCDHQRMIAPSRMRFVVEVADVHHAEVGPARVNVVIAAQARYAVLTTGHVRHCQRSLRAFVTSARVLVWVRV
jgi:hypothetical protein